MVRRTVLLLFVALALASWLHPTLAQQRHVDVVRVQGPINAAAANLVGRVISEAANSGDTQAVVIELDTPGGFDSAMRDIVQKITNSPVPVVVYVSPSGARAASAGTFITLAGHIAAMAPNTAIGAAHPVSSDGGDISGTMGTKVTNDAAAYIRSIATAHRRNADWAERAVRESISASETEALEAGVIDLTASDLPSLLEKINGFTVRTSTGTQTLQTTGASVNRIEMSFTEGFLSLLSDPTIAYVLLTVGMLGLFFEISTPGAILPGVVGGISILLALYSMGSLPVNYTGALLILLAFILFVAEVKITSYGLLTLAGIACMAMGSLMLIDQSGAPFLEISRPVIATVVLLTAAMFTIVVTAVGRAQRSKVVTGREGLVGQRGIARTELDPEGTVFVSGENWNATAEGSAIPAGSAVVVRSVKGLSVVVGKAD